MQPGRKWTVISLEARLAFQEAALVRDPEVGCGMGQNSAERLKENGVEEEWPFPFWMLRSVRAVEAGTSAEEGGKARHRCLRSEGGCWLCPVMGMCA